MKAKESIEDAKIVDSTPVVTPEVNTETVASIPMVPAVKPKNLLSSSVAKAQAKTVAIEQDHSYLFAEEPKDFRELLARFDSLLARDTGIDDFNVDTCRNYVKKIYTELQTQPELEGLMIDKDIANIIHFIRTVRERALETGIKKSDKAKAKAGNVKAKNRFGDNAMTLDLNALPADTIQKLADIGGDDWSL
jgi:hypothetical protein